jgi:hypothetical protein
VNDTSNSNNSDPADDDEGLTLVQLIGSALAAGFGVQSSENRKRDFSRGKPGQFIAIGIIFTVLFVLIMVGIVNLVLGAVGAG